MGEGGLYQLVVDVKFLTKASGEYVSPKAAEEAQKLITRAFNVYCERTNLKVHHLINCHSLFCSHFFRSLNAPRYLM
jgi:hypothetical protein